MDPDAERLLAAIAAGGKPPMWSLTPAEAREANAASRAFLQPEPPEVAEIVALSAPGPHGPVPVRLYRGAGVTGTRAPVLLFAHGGGWVIGDLDSHDQLSRSLANQARCVVASVDYRRAPEDPFPAAVDDCLAAAWWLHERAGDLGLDANRLAVGGDSAGGTIAAVLAVMARDGTAPAVVHQMLVYAPTDMAMDTPSFDAVPDTVPVSARVARWFRDHYVEAPQDRADWRASPALASSLAGVAPAFLLTVRHDPFWEEGCAYARKLDAAGVRVWHLDMNDQLHAFMSWGRQVRAAGTALEIAAAALRLAFTLAESPVDAESGDEQPA